MRLSGRVAIVTGGSRGIGKRIAQALAREGASVVVAARAGADGALATAEREIRAAGGECLAAAGDVSREGDVVDIVGAAVDRYGRIDILVNNAAMRLTTKLLDTSLEDFTRIIDVNVVGPFLMWKHVLPVMSRRGGGNVIDLISTNAPQQPYVGMAPYRMTKAALTFLSADLAQEVAGDRIAVNALDPGPIASEGTAAARAKRERDYGIRIPYHAQDPVEVIDEPIVWLAQQTVDTFTGRTVRRVEFGKTWGPAGALA